jgi:hypothetical protein
LVQFGQRLESKNEKKKDKNESEKEKQSWSLRDVVCTLVDHNVVFDVFKTSPGVLVAATKRTKDQRSVKVD